MAMSRFRLPSPVCFLSVFIAAALVAPVAAGWPEAGKEAKPWTRWWWLGSAVTEAGITRELEAFAAKGLGGVEICPIYGVQGQEANNLEFLSPAWMKMLGHTAREAERLGLGLDLTTGTGWPFGGPWVDDATASASLELVKSSLGDSVPVLPPGRLLVARVITGDGQSRDATDMLRMKQNPPAAWQGARLYALVAKPGIQKVKRAAPGGVGWVVDPFSKDAIHAYLARFDRAFGEHPTPGPRSHFHDSFEYYGASATDRLPEAFRRIHGYDLADHLPALAGEGDVGEVVRVRADYRDTLGRLHGEFLKGWHDWAAARGEWTRNQAHGSPGNLLDHYAVADIPETEIFRHVEADQQPMIRFAASAARATGKNLVSAESFTWLDEHFRVTPEELKPAADFLFLGGVNHIFFHGVPYSPDDVPWPGWLFYASTHMGPEGGLWRDLGAFTGYLRRCQSVLQDGKPDSDVLVFFPFDDILHDGARGLPLFTLHNQHEWLWGTAYHRTARWLESNGYTFDSVTDDLLARASARDGKIMLGTNEFSVLLVPRAKYLSPETLEKLIELAEAGAPVRFQGGLPDDVPGFGNLAARRSELAALRARAERAANLAVWPDDVGDDLSRLRVRRERWAGADLGFVRRHASDGHWYFIVNRSTHTIDQVLALATGNTVVTRLDPWSDAPPQIMEILPGKDGRGPRVVLEPGQSIVLKAHAGEAPAGLERWSEPKPARFVPVAGPWDVSFREGGPVMPSAYSTPALGSWTSGPDARARDFSGTGVYQTRFAHPGPARRVFLDLGKVHVSARVKLNGKDAGTTWFPPHRIEITGMLVENENTLEIEVTSLAANRIAALDRAGAKWKIFHDINFASIHYGQFDASSWLPLDSGLAGPVTLLIEE